MVTLKKKKLPNWEKEIDEKVLKTLMSIVILNLTKDTINDLSANLVKNMTWDAPVAYFDH